MFSTVFDFLSCFKELYDLIKVQPKETQLKINAYVIAGLFLFACLIFYKDPMTSNNEAYAPQPAGYFIKTNTSTEIFTKLQSHAKFAFNSFYNQCKTYDEIRPNTNKCISVYGFSSSLIESIETLHLLNLTEEYSKARNFVKTNFTCKNLHWVSRHDYYSRIVASFIGSYLVTGDKLFYNKAVECTELINDFDYEFAFPRPNYNLNNFSYLKRSFLNGSLIKDFNAGFPELTAMYLITGDTMYLNYVQRVMKRLPIRKRYGLPAVISPWLGMTGTYFNETCPTTSPYYSNFVLANVLYKTKLGTNHIKYFTPNLRVSSWKDYPNLIAAWAIANQTENYFNLSNPQHRVSQIADDVTRCASGNCNEFIQENFKFDGLDFVPMLFNDASMRNMTAYSISNILDQRKREFGYSGIALSDHDDNIQHSELFGSFLKVGALSLMDSDILEDLVLNENGHILRSSGCLYPHLPQSSRKIKQ